MLISRFQFRYILLCVLITISVTILLLRGRYTTAVADLAQYWPSEWTTQTPVIVEDYDSESEALAEVGSEAKDSEPEVTTGVQQPDKVVVLAKVHSENVDWVSDQLPDWQHAIYYMDEPNEGDLHPPENKGRESMAYLTYLIDHYDRLPSTMVFVHAHLDGWPVAWHTDAENYNNVNSIQSLRLDYLQATGYVNMRCIHDPGCPAEVQVHRQDDVHTIDRVMLDAWPYMFGGNQSDVPETIAQPCCSQFAVSKTQALQRSKDDYQRYRQWLLDTTLDDGLSGRVFEYLWHVIFGRDAVYCPDLQQCRCQQFGRC